MSGLRFSIHDDLDTVKIELAGSLSGADVETVYQVWQTEAWNDGLKPLIVDITLLAEADKHGRALLVVMHRFGAEIIANSPQSSAIVQSCVVEPAPAPAKPSWFRRLISGLRKNRHAGATFPLRAEWMSRAWAAR